MDRRIVAWAEISLVFLALYLGVPLAGLSLDRGLGLPTLPAFVRFAGVAFLVVGLGGLAWCFSLFAGARGTPNPRLPPSRLVTSGPYALDPESHCRFALPRGPRSRPGHRLSRRRLGRVPP